MSWEMYGGFQCRVLRAGPPSPPQQLLNPVITHVPSKSCLTFVSSSDGTVNCSEGSLVESIVREFRATGELIVGDAEIGGLGVECFEGRPEGIGKYLK